MRTAFRRLASHPARTIVVTLTLAVGIASGAAIWTVVDRVLLSPFPFADQERLVTLWSSHAEREVPKLEITVEELEMFRRDAKLIEDAAAWSAANFSVVLLKGGQPMEMKANIVSESFFELLGIRPAAGRAFLAEEHKPGAATVAMLSHGAWISRFAGEASVAGMKLTDGENPIEIVGVLPEHLDLPDDAEIVFPLEPGFTDEGSRTNRVLAGLGRLAPGASLEQANRELEVLAGRMVAAHPDSHDGIGYAARPLVDEILGTTRPALKILFAMAALLFLITLFNVTNVFLIEGVARRRELAVRISLGASWGSIFRGLFAQIAIEVALASMLGLALTSAILALVLRVAPSSLPRLGEIGFSGATWVFVLVTALVAAFSLAAAVTLRARHSMTMGALRDGSSKTMPSRDTRRMLDLLAVLQVTVALVSLATAALMIQSFRRLDSIDVGFDRTGVLTAHLPLGYTLAPEPEVKRQRFRDLFEAIRGIPGVESVGSVLMRPLEMELGWDFTFTVDGQGVPEQEANPMANLLAITPGYLEAMGIDLLAGRGFTEADGPESEKVVVISESFARRFWTAEEAIGKRVKSGRIVDERPWLTVIGVVSDVRYRNLTTGKLDIYVPFTQSNWSPNYLAIRTSVDPASVVPQVRRIVAERMPEVPLAGVETTAQLVGEKLAQPRLNATVVALFAIAALFLALVGLYGVLDYAVRQRTSELGLRLALGAERRGLLGMIVGDALKIALAGTLFGLVIAIAGGRLVESFLYEVDPVSAAILIPVASGLIAAALLASLLPAWRASRVDPIVALRNE